VNLRETFLSLSEPPRATENGFVRTYVLPADHPAFAGHFPGHPILPAVTQVFLAQLLVEAIEGTQVRLTGIPQGKFTAPIGPGTRIDIEVGRRSESLWQCRLQCDGHTAATFQMAVVPCDPSPLAPLQ
jgi:3-hydroxyacyl-[acyl-carrier-protein] dehydratase